MEEDRQSDDVYLDALDDLAPHENLSNESPGSMSESNTSLTNQDKLDMSELDSSIINTDASADASGLGDVEDEISFSDDSENYEEVEEIEKKSNDDIVGDHQNEAEADVSGDFVEPDEETARAISELADALFSDENLQKESYLVKHIRRNKNGFVSLKVLNSLRKMKRLTRDYRAIGFAVKKFSSLLELNEAETKVRRHDALTNPLPLSQQLLIVAPEYRTVLVTNLPSDKPPSIASVAELFSSCGPIVQIKIIPSSSPAVGNVDRFLAKHFSAGDGNCAVIEFERLSDAKKTCKNMTDLSNWRQGMRVSLLAAMPRKGDRSSGRATEGTEGSDRENQDRRPPKKNRRCKMKTRVDELSYLEGMSSGSIYSSSGSDTEGARGGWRARTSSPCGSDNGASSRRRVISGSNTPTLANPRTQALQDSDSEDWRARSRRSGSYDSRMPGEQSPRLQSPWALRRLKAEQNTNGSGSVGSLVAGAESCGTRGSIPCLVDAGRVVRQPRGPDGTSGFLQRRTHRVSS